MMLWWMLIACFGTDAGPTASCTEMVAGQKSFQVDGVGVVECGDIRHRRGLPGEVLGSATGLAIRGGEEAEVRVCESQSEQLSVLFADLKMSASATLADRVAIDLEANAEVVAMKVIKPTGSATPGRGTLLGQDVEQVVTPVSVLGTPRIQLVRGRVDGNKACMVSVVYDPAVITDPAVLEPLFAAPK